ncbi:MAG: heme-binding domain-containing protein [Candidatus Binataceae bacterium]
MHQTMGKCVVAKYTARMIFIAVVAMMTMPITGCSRATSTTSAMKANGTSTVVSSNPEVERTLKTSCFDCHSDQHSTPWNAKLAPSYLFGANNARKALDFSDWGGYSANRRSADKAAIAKVVKDDSMPPGDYDFLHPSARLTAEQRSELLQWAKEPASTKP